MTNTKHHTKHNTPQTVLQSIHNHHIGVLTLNRPDVFNALNAEMILSLSSALHQWINHDDIRVILLNANGKHFSSGADLNWMKQSLQLSAEENRKDAKQLSDILRALYDCPKPIVAAAQGSAYGGALGLLACADQVISTPTSQFCFSEVKLGLVPAVISPYVIQAIGQRPAGRLFLTATPFKGKEAQQLGLVDALVEEESQLLPTAQAACETLCQHGPKALQACKQLIRTVVPIEASIASYTVNLIASLRASEEGQEGLTAFFEKRRPTWQTPQEI